MIIASLREKLSNPTTIAQEPFGVLREISTLLNQGDEVGCREAVLRALEHRAAFGQLETVLLALVREVGLFPYLEKTELGLADAVAYEFHRPDHLGEIVFHREQAEVYRRLMARESVILSAPTSFGKSRVIDAVIASGTYKNIVVVVPTIALIDETRRRLAQFSAQFKIVTQISQPPGERNVFVFTAERVNAYEGLPPIDFFVIDEFYKIGAMSEDRRRTVALNQAFYRLARSKAQFYMLGPSVREIPEGLQDRFRCRFHLTTFATVAADHVQVDPGPDPLKTLTDTVRNLAGEPTLVFCKSPKRANDVAGALLDGGVGTSDSATDLASQWMKDEFHPEWTVARAVSRGIGVHHGRLPRSLGQYIVRAFNQGMLQVLVCTSTLIEGVNTKAKNIVILDNVIAQRRYDYFTFNNIRGRAGRMFEHFVGRVFLFHDPPREELPFVDFPVFTQGADTPESVLMQLEPDDLTADSVARLQPFLTQDLLPVELLRRHGSIEPELLLNFAKRLARATMLERALVSWTGFPTRDALRLTCRLIWEHLVPEHRLAGVASGEQLALKIARLALRSDIRTRIQAEFEGPTQYAARSADEAVERVLEFDRTWASFELPRLLRAASEVRRHVLRGPGDYTFYASRVEHLFRKPVQMALEEFGLPLQVTDKIADRIPDEALLDDILARIRNWRPADLEISPFERELFADCQSAL